MDDFTSRPMDFFARMVLEGKVFDLLLIDGNHDYEYALFDLQMAARLVRPGGIVVMPFSASRPALNIDRPSRALRPGVSCGRVGNGGCRLNPGIVGA